MMPPALTVGMATYHDFDGCYFTTQALRLYQKADPLQVEIVIVDNAPQSQHSEMIKGLCAYSGAKYFHSPNPVGTSPSRNKVFEVATGDFVLCMDSHVLLLPGAIEKLLYFAPNAGEHLYSGPMLMDDLRGICTHFNPEWRAEMYGTWGRAWGCPCGATNFTCIEKNSVAVPHQMPLCKKAIGGCGSCGKQIPINPWPGHEQALLALGFKSLGANPNDPPFEIPGQGLGLFGCRREAWLGFESHCTGFGGEELNIHELYFQRGFKAISLPFLSWLHKFGRPNGVPYPLQRYQKVRNYVLWHNLLGKSLDDIYQHFVAPRLISKEHWDHIVADPIAHDVPPPAPCGSCGGSKQVPLPESIEEIYQNTIKVERDFNQHMPKLRELADGCAIVSDISIRHETFIALAASSAQTVWSYSNEHNPTTDQTCKLRSMRRPAVNPVDLTDIPATELLLLNTRHTYAQVYKELQQFAPKVSHYIVLHNTQIFGEQGDGGGPGILVAARQYMREHPEWSVIYHTNDQYGLTVLSRDPADKKRLPGKFTLLANFTKAVTAHVVDGVKKAELPIYEQRLDICAGCEHRVDDACTVCGCDLKTKASWKEQVCPLGFWPAP